MFVLVVGNPFDGLEIVGPFEGAEDAYSHVGEVAADEWYVIEVHPPHVFGIDDEYDDDSDPLSMLDAVDISLADFLTDVHNGDKKAVSYLETVVARLDAAAEPASPWVADIDAGIFGGRDDD